MTAGPDHICGPDTCGANFAYDAAEAVIRRIDLRQPWTSREIGSAVVDAVRPGIEAEATARARQIILDYRGGWDTSGVVYSALTTAADLLDGAS